MKFSLASTALLVLTATSAVAAPLRTPYDPRSVWDPPVTSPHAGTVWHPGKSYTVRWDASHPQPI